MNDITPSTIQPDNHPALLASVSELKTKVVSTYKEQVYRKSLSDLAGMTFEPLAGLRVTFLPSMFPTSSFEQPENSNVVYTVHYVEYLTGHQRILMAVVDLAEGYVPLNVSRTAFKDALKHSLEFHLNESGYSLADTPPDGLRKVSNVHIGHERLEALFNPTAFVKNMVLRYGVRTTREKISVEIVGNHLVSSAPAVALKTLEYRLPGVSSVSGHLMAQELAVELAPYVDKDLIAFFADETLVYLVTIDRDEELLPKDYPNANFRYLNVYRFRMVPALPTYETISRGNFKLENKILSHHLDVTLIDPSEEGKIEVLDPDNWVFLAHVTSASYYITSEYDRLTPFGDEMSFAQFERLTAALNTGAITPTHFSPPQPAPERVVEVPDAVEERILPWTFFDRIRMAWRAFNTPDPIHKE
ncbi:hypothetical protein [Xanthomonas phage RTH11]|nr:hypothetical protein [Xanthomonas phage RTH11]